MATEVVRIANRGSGWGSLPAWCRTGPFLLSILWALLGLLYLLPPGPPGGVGLLPWWYLAIAAISAFTAWSVTVSWIEIGSDTLRVHYGLRTKAFPLNELVGVEAFRRWLKWRSRRWAEDYEIRFLRAQGRLWGFRHVLPPAADRLMAALHRLQKPITVYTWP